MKSADAGLSLNHSAEASIASPFSSANPSLDCVLKVISEGRASLVTSFCCFKYMAIYSLIQFGSVTLLYSISQNLNDLQFMWVDIGIIIPVAIFMGRTRAYSSIHYKRPTASLVSKKVMTSMAGQLSIIMAMQLYVFYWCRRQDWYVAGTIDLDEQIYITPENTVLFLTSCYQYLLSAIVFTVGPPYQESIWSNGKSYFHASALHFVDNNPDWNG